MKYTLLGSSFCFPRAPATLLVQRSSGVKSSLARLVATFFLEQLFDQIMALFLSLRCQGFSMSLRWLKGQRQWFALLPHLVFHLMALCSGFVSLVCSERELRVCSQVQMWSDDQSHYQGFAVVVELQEKELVYGVTDTQDFFMDRWFKFSLTFEEALGKLHCLSSHHGGVYQSLPVVTNRYIHVQ